MTGYIQIKKDCMFNMPKIGNFSKGGVKLEFNDYLVLPRSYENVLVKNCSVDSLK